MILLLNCTTLGFSGSVRRDGTSTGHPAENPPTELEATIPTVYMDLSLNITTHHVRAVFTEVEAICRDQKQKRYQLVNMFF